MHIGLSKNSVTHGKDLNADIYFVFTHRAFMLLYLTLLLALEPHQILLGMSELLHAYPMVLD